MFTRKPARYVAAAAAGRVIPGRGAKVGPLSLQTVEQPTLPGPDWVRLRPRLAGICGSDLTTLDGRSSRYFEPIVSFPFTPGHEVVGDLDDGSRAVLVPVLSCAARGVEPMCEQCGLGRVNRCERIAFGHLDPGLQSGFCAETGGGWSGAMVAHPSQLVTVPDGLSDDGAVMVEPTACAVHAAGQVGEAATVAVIGAGTLGLLTVAALRRFGSVGWLCATAKYPGQRRLAWELGADRVVAPDELGRVVRAVKGSFMVGDHLTGGVDTVVDCVATEASITQALQVVAPGGDVVLAGMPGRATFDLTALWHRETTLRGCYAYTREDFDRAVTLVADADLGRLVTATYPLDRYREAVEHAANAGVRGAVKIAFDLRAEKHR